ncbi:P-loop containing nucleoside triphosphate hydrolase protein [Parathielavia hyrcaniae]|uniref:P-loop containing nucleoside triphosphate hydrolase protein n=1 Tax=Parathielavia hyrcaniae TaxID=113614 RepID=A0AAN6PSJ7_9PEZI|nr:P-loop containing nucleoside triphosphate hydrolase protein [Parathielavia hyrcaniae]
MEPFPSSTLLLVSSFAALSLACLLSIPTALAIARRLCRRGPPEFQCTDAYHDEDGGVTEESSRSFSDTWQRVALVVSSIVGLTASLVILLSSWRPIGHQEVASLAAESGIWVFVFLQAAALSIERSPTRRFELSSYVAWTAVLTLLTPALGIGLAILNHSTSSMSEKGILLLQARSAQLVAAIACIACSILIPRRPDVFYDGRLVDRQATVSAWGNFSFGWATELLRQVARNPELGLRDLPELPHVARSDVLLAHLEQRRTKGRSNMLWRILLATHWSPLLRQMLLGVLSALVSFGPQVALFGLLKGLEDRDNSLSGAPTAGNLPSPWLWVFALASLMLLNALLGARLSWMVQSEIGIPVQAELVSMVFAKSMRLGDPSARSSLQSKTSDDGKGQRDAGGQHSVVNLAAVDARRIADFASSQYLVSASLVQLLVACGLLFSLIGLESLVAGLAVAVLITHLNTLLTRGLSRVQSGVMTATDSRIAALAECFRGIRQVKFSALEKQWEARILHRRETELARLWIAVRYRVALISVWVFFPIVMSAVSLTVYALVHGTVTASVAFTAMSVFSNLDVALSSLPDVLSRAAEAIVSLRRIQDFLDSPEKKQNVTTRSRNSTISLRDATLAWPASGGEGKPRQDRSLLSNVSLTFPPKGLTLIAGRTGCGKTLLLTSILGDCNIVSGAVNISSPPTARERHDEFATPGKWVIDTALAYVSQNPWIENATVRDNITLGLPYWDSRYREVLFATSLEKDLDMLPDGDLTDIGANGVNLSGGQKWRIAFARALYSRAGTLVIDDIFSALDAHTSRHVFEHGLAGDIAKGRTRILATHHIGLCLPRADYCVILDQGRVQHAGSVDALATTNIISHLGLSADETGEKDDAEDQKPASLPSDGPADSPSHSQERSAVLPRFVEDEGRATGSSTWTLYASYLRGGRRGVVPWALAVLGFVVYTILMIGRSLWMAVWTGSTADNRRPEQHALLLAVPHDEHIFALPSDLVNSNLSMDSGDHPGRLAWYIGIYVAISAATCVMGAARTMLLYAAALDSSRGLFENLLHTVLRAPMRWFDTVPQGRIMNRFIADMSLLDTRLGLDLLFGLGRSLELVGIAATTALVCPPLVLPAIVFLALCMRLGSVYLVGAREIKRLESVARSPIFEQFNSCLRGLTTIRAFGLAEKYVGLMHGKVNDYSRASWYLWLLNSWITLRLTLLVALFSTVTAGAVVHMGSIPAPAAGLILSLVFRYNLTMVQAVKQWANLEMDMNAAERVVEYAGVTTENQGGKEVPAAWPTEGLLEVEDLVSGYAPELAPSLNGVSFTILPNQRVGIVGRTGAGKSSLALALFRFIEARSGQIRIDGIDISSIRLEDLRSRLAVIPQDPVLFSGSLRTNLDPFGQLDDAQLYEALESVSLARPTEEEEEAGVFPGLSTFVSEGGQNLSQGQRQLVCLARTVLSRPKILVMDEATSAMDMETDALIQKSLRSEFGCNATTLLVVAHRLSTVADFDRIIVMDAGKVVEFGSPRTLMGISGGNFRSLVMNSGEREHLQQVILGSDT